MTDSNVPEGQRGDFFDQLLETTPREHASFTVGFRGYDKGEVDAALKTLRDQLQRVTADLDGVEGRHSAELEKVRGDKDAEIERLRAEGDGELERDRAADREAIERLEGELVAERARADEAADQVAALTSELVATPGEGDEQQSRQQFEAVLRVAEEQASVLIRNAAVQAERLLEAAREEAETKRADLEADVARITAQAQHDADQVRLKMETEYTAHEARIAREGAHADEKVSQAEQEAATVRTEAEKGAAALRAMVTRETSDLRSDAEREVREMNARVLEFEETLTRRQDDAQQEFLLLHNQAVAHAERITADANEQVSASLEHAQRISSKAEDFEKLMRSQAQTIEADAQVRARETLDRARAKSQKIVDSVMTHANSVLRDAEDRTRQLRWQQQQLNSFMAEVRELIRPEGAPDAGSADRAEQDAVSVPEGVEDIDDELEGLDEEFEDDETEGEDGEAADASEDAEEVAAER
ncbi:DivIVA domain-containing protein [Microbacterium sp.]|uniref:DivIVA domain-containing protein n=1 Tax=Microbacterium sp. TaxID=51671 RepID=UPI003340301A